MEDIRAENSSNPTFPSPSLCEVNIPQLVRHIVTVCLGMSYYIAGGHNGLLEQIEQ